VACTDRPWRQGLLEPHRGSVATVTGRLDVLATFLVDGFAAGLWAVETGADTVRIRLTALGRLAKAARSAVDEEANGLVRYVAPDAARNEVAWPA
jgi:Winged helix DNA-binding domain